jgi:hypothetical protein
MHAARYALTLAATLLAAWTGTAAAQGFAVAVSPPRFELAVKPGTTLRQVIEIENPNLQAIKLRMRSADWTFAADATVNYVDALQPGSCRPWVAIEAREFSVPAASKFRYRFEITPPAGAAPGECRFALLLEGDDQATRAGPISFPVSGRIGIIVYAIVGDAQPQLEVVGAEVTSVNGTPLPVLRVRNSGNAHGRLAGFLSGTDAGGRRLEFEPMTLPILPGETRAIALNASSGRDEAIRIAYPITIRGDLEWGSNRKTPLDKTFAP